MMKGIGEERRELGWSPWRRQKVRTMTSTREQLEYTSTSTAQEKQQELVSFRKFEEEERGGEGTIQVSSFFWSRQFLLFCHTRTNERNERKERKEQTGQEDKGVDGVCREERRGRGGKGRKEGREGERADGHGRINPQGNSNRCNSPTRERPSHKSGWRFELLVSALLCSALPHLTTLLSHRHRCCRRCYHQPPPPSLFSSLLSSPLPLHRPLPAAAAAAQQMYRSSILCSRSAHAPRFSSSPLSNTHTHSHQIIKFPSSRKKKKKKKKKEKKRV